MITTGELFCMPMTGLKYFSFQNSTKEATRSDHFNQSQVIFFVIIIIRSDDTLINLLEAQINSNVDRMLVLHTCPDQSIQGAHAKVQGLAPEERDNIGRGPDPVDSDVQPSLFSVRVAGLDEKGRGVDTTKK